MHIVSGSVTSSSTCFSLPQLCWTCVPAGWTCCVQHVNGGGGVCVCAQGAIQEIMDAQRSSSAGPTTSEYKDLIRQSLTTAGKERNYTRTHLTF